MDFVAISMTKVSRSEKKSFEKKSLGMCSNVVISGRHSQSISLAGLAGLEECVRALHDHC